ncbi:Hypothetical predicted protein [Pelobates cultripes]|uniref:Transposase element L1Md-A101/L1Md-A102/L1Md-A2 n=1 Tax=Pelobates cultripes TaxID=61616 RepID=A0AAD1TLV0_PELCU|nr:Hypothetical predicted protein [Pelobates cultripes]
MPHSKTRRHTDKGDKMNFFAQKRPPALQHTDPGLQDGAGYSGGSSPRSDLDTQTEVGLTASLLQAALDKQSTKLIATWQESVAEIKRDLHDLGSRTGHVETKVDNIVDAHNQAVDRIQALETQLAKYEVKLMPLEDRSRRSNQRLCGIPEEVLEADLPAFVNGFFKALLPDIPVDILLLDCLHRVPKPKHITASLPRDTLLKAHYFHVKELILRSSRTAKDLPPEFSKVRDFADISAATLRHRKTFQKVTEVLREHRITYRWGFPIRLLVMHNGATTVLLSVEEGFHLLQRWNLCPAESTADTPSPKRLERDWSQA